MGRLTVFASAILVATTMVTGCAPNVEIFPVIKPIPGYYPTPYRQFDPGVDDEVLEVSAAVLS